MTTRMLCGAIGLALFAAPALAQDAAPTGPIRDADAAMTCQALADEAASLSAAMGGGQSRPSVFDRLGGVARAGASMLVPGAGLAIAGADALTGPEREQKEAEALARQNRWYYLNGLYAGARCAEAAEASAVEAEAPAPAVAPTPATPTPIVVVQQPQRAT